MTTQPKIALGTWAWGDTPNGQVFGNQLSTADLKPVVDAAMAAGLTLWDSALGHRKKKSVSSYKLIRVTAINYQRSSPHKWPRVTVTMKLRIC